MKTRIYYIVTGILVIVISVIVISIESSKSKTTPLTSNSVESNSNVGAYPDPSDLTEDESVIFSRPSTQIDTEGTSEELNELETNLAKNWFDVRNSENPQESMENLTEEFKNSLEIGVIPQIATNFELSFIENDSSGIQQSYILYGDGKAGEFYNIVGTPELEGNRAHSFFKSGETVIDLGYIPMVFEYYQEIGDNILFSGYNFDSNDIVLFVLDKDSLDFSQSLLNTQTGRLRTEGSYYILDNSEDLYYLYQEYENEGANASGLYVVDSSTEEGIGYKFTEVNGDILLKRE